MGDFRVSLNLLAEICADLFGDIQYLTVLDITTTEYQISFY